MEEQRRVSDVFRQRLRETRTARNLTQGDLGALMREAGHPTIDNVALFRIKKASGGFRSTKRLRSPQSSTRCRRRCSRRQVTSSLPSPATSTTSTDEICGLGSATGTCSCSRKATSRRSYLKTAQWQGWSPPQSPSLMPCATTTKRERLMPTRRSRPPSTSSASAARRPSAKRQSARRRNPDGKYLDRPQAAQERRREL